jgi:hypothetical protein
LSDDYGNSWHLAPSAFDGGPDAAFFSSIYETKPGEVLILTGLQRAQGGRRIVGRFGSLK